MLNSLMFFERKDQVVVSGENALERSGKRFRANRNQGRIYVLLNESELVKIGTSQKPNCRMRKIESISGYKILKTYCTEKCWNPYKVEKAAQIALKGFNKSGEWFNCSFDTAVSAVKNAFDTLAIFENDAPKVNPESIDELFSAILGTNKLKPHQNLFLSKEEKIKRLSEFHNCKIDVEFFTSEKELYEELGESQEIKRLTHKYPSLSLGEYNQKEFYEYIDEVYDILLFSGLCPFEI